MVKLNFMKLQRFCSTEEIVKWPKRQATEWEKLYIWQRIGAYSLQKLQNLHIKKTNTRIKNWAKQLDWRFSEEKEMQMANEYFLKRDYHP